MGWHESQAGVRFHVDDSKDNRPGYGITPSAKPAKKTTKKSSAKSSK